MKPGPLAMEDSPRGDANENPTELIAPGGGAPHIILFRGPCEGGA